MWNSVKFYLSFGYLGNVAEEKKIEIEEKVDTKKVFSSPNSFIDELKEKIKKNFVE